MVIPVDFANTTVDKLKEICQDKINTDSKFKPYRTVKFDTLKIYTQPFKNKTQNLIINIDNTGFLNDNKALLKDVDVYNETELSFFNLEAYKQFEKDPVMKWE
ncbi:hypothetical protein IWW55_005238 [Coemansia sp. RSA 2706]|nr:hypothetical protein IWW55_005238 [Coemansia sp. RSA 2706]KAJ2320329.1 hypothetical protein IWW51_004654 [Coemansia sp. RSA 2702]